MWRFSNGIYLILCLLLIKRQVLPFDQEKTKDEIDYIGGIHLFVLELPL
jgi:hypothetical protein